MFKQLIMSLENVSNITDVLKYLTIQCDTKFQLQESYDVIFTGIPF